MLNPGLEPNQTRWRLLNLLTGEKLNLTAPRIQRTTQMIICVPLAPHAELRRMEIRQSWASRNYSKAIQIKKVHVLFVVGQSPFTDELIRIEASRDGDILLVPSLDTYKGLVYKELLAFRWINLHFPMVDVAKVDADVVLELYKLVNKEVHLDKFILGSVHNNVKAIRSPTHQWYIPPSIYQPTNVPNYVDGPLYLTSSSALKTILIYARRIAVVEVEDIFFTGIIAEKASIPRIRIKDIYSEMPTKQPCHNGKPSIIGYAVHATKIGIDVEYQKMKQIRCMNWIESFFSW